jgi:sec-independent protein translocase protein TatA
MPNVGVPELIIFAFILLLLFGAKRIPEIMRSLGTGMREFKEGITDVTTDVEPPREAIPAPAKPEAASATAEQPPARDPVEPLNH